MRHRGTRQKEALLTLSRTTGRLRRVTIPIVIAFEMCAERITMEAPMKDPRSHIEEQAADALRRARKLPVGPMRNDLRQLAMGLLWLHRNGMDALVEDRIASLRSVERPVGRVAR